MKMTIEDIIRNYLLTMGKKGPLRRIVAIVGLFVCVTFFHLVHYIRDNMKHVRDPFSHLVHYIWGNKKRLTMVMMSMVLFAAYASFSFPIFSDTEEHKMNEQLAALISDESVSLVAEAEVNMEELEDWEEELYLEEDEEDLLWEEDQIVLEDILSYRREQEGIAAGEREETVPEPPGEREDADVSFSADDWKLILVNKQHPIPENYDFTLANIKGSQQCDARIIDDLLDMMQAAKEAGFNLLIKSPYRSDARQEWLFARKIKLYMNKGMSYMDAYKLSSQVVMVPDSSEHQIGLALDIVCDYYETLTEGFGDTEAGIWLEEHCAEFGFIVRYPKGREYITSVEYEPWHFRYVGVEAATIIMEQELTLEEFVEDLK